MNKISSNNALKSPKNAIVFIIFVIFGFILYGNTLSHDFALDDSIAIRQNVFTKQGIEGIDEIFKYDSFVGFWMHSYKNKTAEQIQEEKKLVAGGRYRPLSYALFALEREVFGKKAGAHHFFNILYYILTAVLLYLFLKKLFPGRIIYKNINLPLVAVLLFMAHPVHTEVVANIKGRDEILSLLGSLLAAYTYIKYFEKKKFKWIIISSLSLFIALLSKENAITWLAIIPISTLFFKDISLKKQLVPFFSLIIASGIFLLIRQSVLGWSGTGASNIASELMNNPFLHAEGTEKAGTILITLLIYLKLLFFPHPLTYDYYPYHIELHKISEPLPLLSLLIYILLFALMIWALITVIKRKSKPWLKISGFISLLYLAPLSVVSNIFFPIGTFMNERFIYFSSIAFVVMLAVFVYSAVAGKKSKRTGIFVFSLLVIILGLYSFKTISRNKAWKDDFTLFTTDVQTSVNSAKSNTSAGGKLLEKAKTLNNKEKSEKYVDSAINYLHRAIEIHPEYVDPMLLLGNAYYQKNHNVAKAVYWYKEILKLRPSHTLAIQNIQKILPSIVNLMATEKSVNTPDEIIEVCNSLDSVKPGIPEVYRIKGHMYARYKNNFKKAIPLYRKALKINPNDKDAWTDLGVIYGQSGNLKKTLQSFKKVAELKPKNIKAIINIGITYKNMGKIDSALNYFHEANEMKPDNLQSLYYLGRTYQKAGDIEKANKYFRKYKKLEAKASKSNKN